MARPTPRPTDAELAILAVLWEDGPSTVRHVHQRLGAASAGGARPARVGYTTTLKLMQIMLVKGLISRDERRRSHVYSPVATRHRTQRRLLRDLLDRAFGGSTAALVLQALSTRRASPGELAEIRRLLDRAAAGDS